MFVLRSVYCIHLLNAALSSVTFGSGPQGHRHFLNSLVISFLKSIVSILYTRQVWPTCFFFGWPQMQYIFIVVPPDILDIGHLVGPDSLSRRSLHRKNGRYEILFHTTMTYQNISSYCFQDPKCNDKYAPVISS